MYPELGFRHLGQGRGNIPLTASKDVQERKRPTEDGSPNAEYLLNKRRAVCQPEAVTNMGRLRAHLRQSVIFS